MLKSGRYKCANYLWDCWSGKKNEKGNIGDTSMHLAGIYDEIYNN
jgi:hypothetical protein